MPKQGTEKIVTTTTTRAVLVSFSEDRTAITLSAIGADCYVTADPNASGTSGLKITVGQVPTVLCLCHMGLWVRKQLFVFTSAGAGTVWVGEGFEPWPAPRS